MTSVAHPRSTTDTPRTRSIWVAGALTAVVAVLANSAIYLLGQLTPAEWAVVQAGTTAQLPVFAPASASVLGVAAGTLALWVLARFSWGLVVWTVGAVVVALGSLPAPFQAAADVWTGVLLALMHVVALVVALFLLRPAGRRRT